jgi:hypothetical protein
MFITCFGLPTTGVDLGLAPLFADYLPAPDAPFWLTGGADAEGWALYAERVAWEQRLLPTPADNIGRLTAELFRAVRLVVELGPGRQVELEGCIQRIEHSGVAFVDIVIETHELHVEDTDGAIQQHHGQRFVEEHRLWFLTVQ